MSPVEARGCLAGPPRRASQGTHPPKIRLGCGCTAAPRPRSPRPGVGGRSGPAAPAWAGCSELVLPDGLRLRLRPGQDVLWGGLAAGAWALGHLPCPLFIACWGHGAGGLPRARCCDGSRWSPPCGGHWYRLGAQLGQDSAPSVSLAGGAAAAWVSGRPWCPRSGCGPPPRSPPMTATRLADPGGSAGGAGGRRLPGARAQGRLAGPQPCALPASPPWGTGLGPGWRGGRSPGKRGSGRGCRPVSRRALS